MSSTWEPYPTPAEQPKREVATAYEAPPWGPTATEIDAPSQGLVVTDSGRPTPIDPDLDGDGVVDKAERTAEINRRNRARWRKPVVDYRPSDGWDRRQDGRARRQPTPRTTTAKDNAGCFALTGFAAVVAVASAAIAMAATPGHRIEVFFGVLEPTFYVVGFLVLVLAFAGVSIRTAYRRWRARSVTQDSRTDR